MSQLVFLLDEPQESGKPGKSGKLFSRSRARVSDSGAPELLSPDHFTGQKVSHLSHLSHVLDVRQAQDAPAEASSDEVLAWVQTCIERAYEPGGDPIPAPPSWANVEAVPFPDCQCTACGSQNWGSDGRGWACSVCHPLGRTEPVATVPGPAYRARSQAERDRVADDCLRGANNARVSIADEIRRGDLCGPHGFPRTYWHTLATFPPPDPPRRRGQWKATPPAESSEPAGWVWQDWGPE